MNNLFSGVGVALPTFFGYNGQIDVLSLEKHVKSLIKSVNAVVLFGSTGEPLSLSEKEKEIIYYCVYETVNKRIPIIVGVDKSFTLPAIKECVKWKNLKADGLLVLTPYLNKCSQDGIYRHYKEICSSVDLPVILYNVPSRTNVSIDFNVLSKLCKIENFCGIKQADANFENYIKTFKYLLGGAKFYSGEDKFIEKTLNEKVDGYISVIANILPNTLTAVYNLYKLNKIMEAETILTKIRNLISALETDANPIPIKYALSLLGIGNGEMRLPLMKLNEKNQETVKEFLAENIFDEVNIYDKRCNFGNLR